MTKELLNDRVLEHHISDIILEYKADMEIYEDSSSYFLNEMIYIFKCYNYIIHFLRNEEVDFNNVLIKKYNDVIYFTYNTGSKIHNIFFQICDLTDDRCIYCYDFHSFFDMNLFNFNYLHNFTKWIDKCLFCNNSCKKFLMNYIEDNNIEDLLKYKIYSKVTNDFDDALLLNRDLKIFIYTLD